MANSTIAPRESMSADCRTSASGSASMLRSSTKSRAHQIGVLGTQIPRTLRNEAQTAAAVLADRGGLPIPVRLKTKVCLPVEVVQNLSAEVQSNDGASTSQDSVSISEVADIHSLLSNVLEKMVDRMRGGSLRSDGPPKQPLAIVEIISSIEPLARPPTETPATMLRVGSLELDLINRTARRGSRSIDLRPCEFRLLKYMMQQCGRLLTRAKLFEDVWNYKFTPETNLVDVQLGRLRRKVDASNETPMIRTVRGAGFILSAAE
jgi:DNA-binding response OmpR family regulator